MKKLLFILAVIVFPVIAEAANGDTTWVQTFNDKWLDHYGNFDTLVQFPDGSKSYRKIIMTVTLGKYQCPGNPQYCGDWDYTFDTYLMKSNGDSIELGRLITPYANASYARTPWTWKERYEFDVTDYYPLLKDSGTVRVGYSGYSWGFTVNIQFAFIEGTPARNVVGVDRLWHGYFGFGGASSIDTKITQFTKTPPTGTQSAEMKFIISGHGSDNNYCSEFCKKYYQVKLNSTQIDQQDIWRADCGFNHLYPQSGTWVYDRGNWCPGDIVFTKNHKLAGVAAGTNYDIDVDFETYSGNGGAGYGIDAAVVYYGGYNHNLDASLEDIISPNIHEKHFKKNPISDNPQVVVKNTGSATVTSIKFEYGINGNMSNTHTWSGSLAALDTMTITFPELYDLRTVKDSNNTFAVKITQVNGVTDEDNTNNNLQSRFVTAPVWPKRVLITFKTNNLANETNWKIFDAMNNIVAQRDGPVANTVYIDSVTFGPGSYRLVVSDAGCDGLSFWANSGAGSGMLTVRPFGVIQFLPLQGYFGGDFGCGFTQAFTFSWPTSVETEEAAKSEMKVFPNPANNTVHLSIASTSTIDGYITITDLLGKTVMQMKCTSYEQDINTENLTSGVYMLSYKASNAPVKMQTKLIIAK
jgi:hypothetical protein